MLSSNFFVFKQVFPLSQLPQSGVPDEPGFGLAGWRFFFSGSSVLIFPQIPLFPHFLCVEDLAFGCGFAAPFAINPLLHGFSLWRQFAVFYNLKLVLLIVKVSVYCESWQGHPREGWILYVLSCV